MKMPVLLQLRSNLRILTWGAIVPEWIGDVFTKALGYAFLPEDQQPSEEELSAMYMDSLNSAIDNHAGDVVTNTVDVTLSLVDDEWKINATDDVIDAMVGGMMSSFSSLGDSFGGLEESSEPTETVRTESCESWGLYCGN